MLDSKFSDAVKLASEVHSTQVRKGSGIPYISHPLSVAATVIEFGGDQDQAIAALLHDTLEDGGPEYTGPILGMFGERVLKMVEACTDGVPDETGTKPPWEARKTAYLEHLAHADDDSLLVSACDKLVNARAILDDLLDTAVGLAVFSRFSAPMDRTLWYYESLTDVFKKRGSPVAFKLAATVAEIRRLAV